MEYLGWHFLKNDRKLGYGDGRIVSLGETLKVDPSNLSLCIYGLHASISLRNALVFASRDHAILCRVKLSGKIISGFDKLVASERTVLGWRRADSVLHMLQQKIAEDILQVFKKRHPNDGALRKAVDGKKLWLDGKISDRQMIELRGGIFEKDHGYIPPPPPSLSRNRESSICRLAIASICDPCITDSLPRTIDLALALGLSLESHERWLADLVVSESEKDCLEDTCVLTKGGSMFLKFLLGVIAFIAMAGFVLPRLFSERDWLSCGIGLAIVLGSVAWLAAKADGFLKRNKERGRK